MTPRSRLLVASLLPFLSGLPLAACTSDSGDSGGVSNAGVTGTGTASGNASGTNNAGAMSAGPGAMMAGGQGAPAGQAPAGNAGNPTPNTMDPSGGAMMGDTGGAMAADDGSMDNSMGDTGGAMAADDGSMDSNVGDTGGAAADGGGAGGTMSVPEEGSGGDEGTAEVPAGDPPDDSECVLPDFPDAADLPDLGVKLPDPFTFYDGTPVTTKAQWACRRKEILAMAAKYLYGPIPGDCDEVSGTVSGGNISISCTVGGSTESFSASISGNGEAINLSLSGGILPQGKSLSLGNGNEGKIRSLYGLSELNPNIANAWMVNRVIDVLELNPDSGHDPTKMAVSGCSGCGKGAFFVGVFSRIPLTVIVESGGGGGTSWRMTEWFAHGEGQSEWNCSDRGQGIDVLEETGICGPWVTSAAKPFRDNPATVNNLPFDQHLLLATIAPRYLVHFTNSNFSWCWLAGTSEALASWAAHSVYNALGVPENHSFEVYDGGHCGVGDTGIAAAMFDRAINGNMNADTGHININDSYMQLPQSEWKDIFIDWDMDTILQ